MTGEPSSSARDEDQYDARECQFCGHFFQTRRQRVEHEQRAGAVKCPCGDVCREPRG